MKDDLVRLLQASNRLPSPPGVALRILELARSDDATLEDLSRTLSTDPALAGRILKFVNSPQAGLGRSISSLEQAVSQIGFRGVQMMALSFSLASAGRGQVCTGFEFEMFWSRSLACAVASKILAHRAGHLDPNEAFITGLLYHIGQIALACGAPEDYSAVLEQLPSSRQPLIAVEEAVLQCNHLEVGAWLLQEWKLPKTIWQTIEQTLRPLPPDAGGRLAPSNVLRIADVIATLLADSKSERQGKADESLRLMNQYFGLDADGWSTLYDDIVAEWKAYGQLLSVKAGTDLSFRDLTEEACAQMVTLSAAAQRENLGMREENQRLLQRVRTDALTGVANRAAFDERLSSELSRAQRAQRPILLCLVDIDDFKAVNDAHGHQIGDQVLQAVAKALDETIRKMDFVARYGGEEFAVIAPECTPDHAELVADRLRSAIANIRFEAGGARLSITASVGAAFADWPGHGRSEAELIREADKALYQAKHEGRNCSRLAQAA